MLNHVGLLFCDRCRMVLGELDKDEREAHGDESGKIDLCFDCSPDEADAVPDFFEDLHPGEIITMGDAVFVAWDIFPLRLVEVGVPSHAHASTPAVSLSSSTKLNKPVLKDGRWTAKYPIEKDCSTCGGDGHVYDYLAALCPVCGGQWPQITNIILPSWVLDQPRPTKICLDCQATNDAARFAGYSGPALFCEYHHALLIEQNEDGSLGWGHE